MKKKNGITLIALVIAVVIMAILLAVIVINGTEVYSSADKLKLQNEITQLEILTQNYIKRNPDFNWETVQVDISGYTQEEKQQFSGENIVDDKITLYIVDLQAIDAEEVAYGTQMIYEKDRYLYSSVTQKIYYELGRMIENKVYYRVDY